jgi:hypothetical protein
MTRLEKAKQLGIKFITAPNLSIEDGIEATRSAFSKIWVDEKNCSKLIKSLENYRQEWDTKKQIYKSQPLHDIHSHACFVGETLIKTNKGNKPIKDIIAGDYVETPFGIRKVLAKHESLDTLTYRIKIGKTVIESSKNHEFFSNRGLVYADSLRYNDVLEYNSKTSRFLWKKIYTYLSKEFGIEGFKKSFLSLKTETRQSLMDTFLDGTIFTTFQPKQNSIHAQVCIGMFGRFIMVIYQKVITCITSMVTQEITTSQICNVFSVQNISQNICLSQEVGHNQKDVNKFCLSLTEKQKLGMRAKKDLNGIENMHKIHYQDLPEKNIKRHVPVAQKNSLEKLHINSSVLMRARQKIESGIKKILLIGLVVSVKLYSFVINTLLKKHAVKSVQLCHNEKPKKLFDLTVDTDNCYYTNGYLVSNSDAMRYLAITLPKTRDGLSSDELDKRYQDAMLGPSSRLPAVFRDDFNAY